MTPPEKRFSRLRIPTALAGAHNPHMYFQVVEGGSDRERAPHRHGIVAHLHKTGDPRAKRAEELLALLLERDAEMMDWIGSTSENARLFAENPKAAILKALSGVTEEMLKLE